MATTDLFNNPAAELQRAVARLQEENVRLRRENERLRAAVPPNVLRQVLGEGPRKQTFRLPNAGPPAPAPMTTTMMTTTRTGSQVARQIPVATSASELRRLQSDSTPNAVPVEQRLTDISIETRSTRPSAPQPTPSRVEPRQSPAVRDVQPREDVNDDTAQRFSLIELD